MTSPPGESPENPGSPGRTAPGREIQLPGTEQPGPGTEQPGKDPGRKHQPEVPAPAQTQEIPAPPPYEIPDHDIPRARSVP
ncbi:hypothetical protein [Sorangium sp. So ce1000]|uniref:hypothetical protein n=1 Tax=Sorangium sp. So ce1000 TaxID=3133325 RepID=UPI003F5E7637